jgi:hypothetical protein
MLYRYIILITCTKLLSYFDLCLHIYPWSWAQKLFLRIKIAENIIYYLIVKKSESDVNKTYFNHSNNQFIFSTLQNSNANNQIFYFSQLILFRVIFVRLE